MEDVYNKRLEGSKERLPDECTRSVTKSRTRQSSHANFQLAEMQLCGEYHTSGESTGTFVIGWNSFGHLEPLTTQLFEV
jgi:hypothetical protein